MTPLSNYHLKKINNRMSRPSGCHLKKNITGWRCHHNRMEYYPVLIQR